MVHCSKQNTTKNACQKRGILTYRVCKDSCFKIPAGSKCVGPNVLFTRRSLASVDILLCSHFALQIGSSPFPALGDLSPPLGTKDRWGPPGPSIDPLLLYAPSRSIRIGPARRTRFTVGVMTANTELHKAKATHDIEPSLVARKPSLLYQYER